MVKTNDFATIRGALMRRQKFSYRLAYLARMLCVCVCLFAYVLVCVAALNAGPVLALFIVAVITTLVCIPLYVITAAQIGVLRPKHNRAVAHT